MDTVSADRYAELHRAHRWDVPRDFNVAHACCRRWAGDRARFALYWEDESGERNAWTFFDLQQQANRLSNALVAMGAARGDRIALMLPQRPETAIAHIAINQIGAVAVPLSFLFGPEALQYRLQNSETKIAFVDPQSLGNLAPIRDCLPHLSHVIGAAGARESWITSWESLQEQASRYFDPATTRASDPAFLVYTSGTTGPPKGALMPQSCVLGNLPGFVYSHNDYPQPGDLFWSPADWAWTGGLMDALLPALYFGQPIVGYHGRFEPERALRLIERYQIRNSFLFPTALKMMMKAYPRPRDAFDVNLRSIMSAGEAVGTTVFEWARDALGVTINEMFGQTEMNYIVGNSHANWPAKPGSMGRPYPGHRIAVIDDSGNEVPTDEAGDVAVNRIAPDGTPDPVFFLEYFKNPEATRAKFTGDWCRTGDMASVDDDGYLWYQGRSDDMFKAAGYRIGPSEIENCLVKHPAVANAAIVPSPDDVRGNVVKAFIVLASGHSASAALEDEIRAHVRKFLAPYEYPKEIEFIDALPMTTTGKVQRKILREREAARKAQTKCGADEMNSDVVEGGCLCGAIRYRIMGTALSRGICHCRTCRRASGAPSVAWVTFRSSDVSFLAGEPTIFRSSPPVLRTFCGRCGTPLTYRHASDPDTIDVTTVSLDVPERFAPEREIWTEDKLPWEALNDALPHYRRTRSEGTA